MKTNRTTILLAAALVAAVLPILPSAAAEDEVAPLPPACEAALSATRDQLIAQQGVITMPEAVALLQSNAGEVCGFDVYAGDVGGIDPRALGNFLQIGTPTGIKIDGGDGGTGVSDLVGRAKIVPCTRPGAGPGSIDGLVLNVPIQSDQSVGSWNELNPSTVEVTGDGGTLGGTQAGQNGIMRIAGVSIPALSGDTDATCVTTQVEVEETCWWLIIDWHCEKITKAVLAVCGATADQSLADLVRLSHDYEAEDAPDEC